MESSTHSCVRWIHHPSVKTLLWIQHFFAKCFGTDFHIYSMHQFRELIITVWKEHRRRDENRPQSARAQYRGNF